MYTFSVPHEHKFTLEMCLLNLQVWCSIPSRLDNVQFEIYSESLDGPVNYVMDSTAALTPFNVIDLSNNTLVSPARYHPMVSVEISKLSNSTVVQLL